MSQLAKRHGEELGEFPGVDQFVESLRILGVDETFLRDPTKWEVIGAAEPKTDQMSDVYRQLNQDLERLASAGPIDVEHITGEARVLVDPEHRRVVRESGARGGRTHVGCRQAGDSPVTDAYGFFGAQLRELNGASRRWASISWPDVVDICSLASQGVMRVYVMPVGQPVHFSVYGEDRVLLQGAHPHPTERKWVWYVRSQQLVDQLRPLARELLQSSRPIPATAFTGMLQWLSSPEILPLTDQDYGSRLDARSIRESDLDRLLRAGFVERARDQLRVTLFPSLEAVVRRRDLANRELASRMI